MKVVAKYIEMVAWFTKDGCPNPVRFRIEGEDKIYTTIKVDKILSRNMERLAGNNMLVFKCQSNIDNIQRVYEIKYELSTCRWMLFKI